MLARQSVPPETAAAILGGLAEGLARRKLQLSDAIDRLDPPDATNLHRLFNELVAVSRDRTQSPGRRIAAIDLGRHLRRSDHQSELVAYLDPTEPREVQQAALRVLGASNVPAVATELLSRWNKLTPPLREEVVNVLLSRPIWHEPLIAALETGDVPIAQISIPQRTRLAAIRDEKLAGRVKQVLASFVIGPRKDVIDQYQGSLRSTGDRDRGQLVYRRECANCHKLRGEGHDVGPSLETVQHRSPQEILIHVLDPNREVSPNFLEYTVRLTDGRVLTGVIANESDSGLTLRRAQNQEDSILRAEIDDIASSGKSLMPEGVEQKINPQEMADLIAFLKQQ